MRIGELQFGLNGTREGGLPGGGYAHSNEFLGSFLSGKQLKTITMIIPGVPSFPWVDCNDATSQEWRWVSCGFDHPFQSRSCITANISLVPICKLINARGFS